MNKMRFGAILISADWHVGFYLSRRVVLTVPHPGVIRAVSYDDFGKCKVFARNGVAVSCFEAMMQAIGKQAQYRDSIEMICSLLRLPENADTEELCDYMEQKHGAVLENFEIKMIQEDPDTQTNQQRRSKMEKTQTSKTVEAAEATIDSIRKLMDAIGNDDELKQKLEDTLAALTGKTSAKEEDASEPAKEPQVEAEASSAETEEDDAVDDDDDDDDTSMSSDSGLSDIFNEDALAGMVVGFAAGAAVVGGGVLLHKLITND